MATIKKTAFFTKIKAGTDTSVETITKLNHVTDVFGFLLPRNIEVTAIEFAEIITDVYDANNPKTNEAVKLLQNV